MPTLYSAGDALKGERIAVQAREIDKFIEVKPGSSSHRIQKTTLHGSAFCVIELPFKQVREREK